MKTYSELSTQWENAGFESYSSHTDFEDTRIEHEIVTCTKGDFSGEVIDVYYVFSTGAIVRVDISMQFANQKPKFKFK